MARNLIPEGMHVAHVIIDGQILLPDVADTADCDAQSVLDPDEIAQSYWQLVEQDRSAWTLELGLGPQAGVF